MLSPSIYRWFYDHIHCRYYDLVMRWCFLPFGGERRCRRQLLTSVLWSESECILELCCGTGGATQSIVAAASRGLAYRGLASRGLADSRLANGCEMGCGDGCRFIGLDQSVGQLRYAARKTDLASVVLVAGDAARVCFPDGSFDKVIITHALHEMMHSQRLRVLREAWRVLRDGGEVVILELDRPPGWLWRQFVAFWLFYWLPFNFETPTRRDMIRHGLTNEVAATGFQEVRKISYGGGALQTVKGKKVPVAPVSVH